MKSDWKGNLKFWALVGMLLKKKPKKILSYCHNAEIVSDVWRNRTHPKIDYILPTCSQCYRPLVKLDEKSHKPKKEGKG